jgi:hypothetical protein
MSTSLGAWTYRAARIEHSPVLESRLGYHIELIGLMQEELLGTLFYHVHMLQVSCEDGKPLGYHIPTTYCLWRQNTGEPQ